MLGCYLAGPKACRCFVHYRFSAAHIVSALCAVSARLADEEPRFTHECVRMRCIQEYRPVGAPLDHFEPTRHPRVAAPWEQLRTHVRMATMHCTEQPPAESTCCDVLLRPGWYRPRSRSAPSKKASAAKEFAAEQLGA